MYQYNGISGGNDFGDLFGFGVQHLERDDGDKDLNGYVGVEKSINEELGLFVEYDLAMNDNTGRSIGDGKGYLNAGLKWSMQNKFYLEFIWKNVLENNKYNHQSGRVIRMSYIEYF